MKPSQRPTLRRPPTPRQQGFALAAVLWLMAGLTIVVALVGDAALNAKQRVAQLRERTDFVQSAISTRAQLQYRLSASRPTSAGLTDGVTTIWTDGTPYRAYPQSLVQLQDLGGLISLNAVPRELLTRYLEICGIPADKTPPLLDALEDYIDTDHLTRINGAEREAYALAGQRPPRNSPLLSVPELWQVMGWAEHRTLLQSRSCVTHLTTHSQSSLGGTRVNLSTAPSLVLQASGLNAEAVQDIVRARGDAEALAQRANQSGGAGLFGGTTFTLKSLRVRHTHPTGPWVMEYTLHIDGSGPDTPWTLQHITTSSQSPGPIAGASGVVKLSPQPWPQEPPAVTTSDAAKLLNL
jgi:general secretion pathway protein K